MKSEKEIRKRIADTKVVRGITCNCPPGGHALQCHVGARMFDASVSVLQWVLEENDAEERMAERLAAQAARLKGGGE